MSMLGTRVVLANGTNRPPTAIAKAVQTWRYNMYYTISSAEPALIPYSNNLLEGTDSDENCQANSPPCKTLPGECWPRRVCNLLGFCLCNTFPVYWDGGGCLIFARSDPRDLNIPISRPARQFKYLAFLDVVYEEGIVVGIPDEAALLQFYQLIQPMLTLQIDKRFHWKNDEGYWDGGKSWDEIYRKECTEYQRRNQLTD
jgi:hypothetical protein